MDDHDFAPAMSMEAKAKVHLLSPRMLR
jgi:hypothetical protein